MKNKKEIVIATGYTVIMAIAMATAYHIFGYKYTDVGINNVLVYFEAAMTCYALFVYMKFYKGKAYHKIRITPWLIVYSFIILVITVLFVLQKGYLENSNIFIKAFITTIFIAISEESIYRGIVLQGYLENNSKIKSIICSAVLFSLLHAVNVFAGFEISSVGIQLLNTFVHGMATGCLMVLTGNLIPFIVFHFIWDLVMLSSSFVLHNIAVLFIMLLTEAIFAVSLLRLIYKKEKNHN